MATANGPTAADAADPAAVRALPSLLANMLIARIDFLLRFVVGMLYGARSRAACFAGWDMPADIRSAGLPNWMRLQMLLNGTAMVDPIDHVALRRPAKSIHM